jgi:hypothetical protein
MTPGPMSPRFVSCFDAFQNNLVPLALLVDFLGKIETLEGLNALLNVLIWVINDARLES